MTRIEVPDSCSDFKDRATSRFRIKLHSHAESLRLESLDIPKFGRESLDIPKFECERLDMGRAVSGLVWKVEASPPWLRGTDFWSRRLQLGLERRARKTRRFLYGLEECFLGRAVSTLVWAVTTLIAKVWKFFGRAVSASVYKVASSPPWSENCAAFFFGRVVSATV